MTSPDLLPGRNPAPAAAGIVDIIYVHLGQPADAFYVSPEFARTHRLTAGVFPLPDDYGDWVRELKGCCSQCFQKTHHGEFDHNARWRPWPLA